VVNAGGGVRGYWGEVLTVAAQAVGVLGLVIDGGVRDTDQLAARGFPTFSRSIAIRGTTKHWTGLIGEPVLIGGVTVARGDTVVADTDGIVVIPAKQTERVLERSRERLAKEREVLRPHRERREDDGPLRLPPLTDRSEMDTTELKASVSNAVAEHSSALIELSHRIHANPELGFAETKASGWLADELERAGFDVARGTAGLATAFRATYGDGALNIGICAEYDALSRIGHACGHNIIAAASIGAGLALATVARELGVTVTVLGTPAEEGGAGKISMLHAGAFAPLHAALMVHPGPREMDAPLTRASIAYAIRYDGHAAHAAMSPERGRNALDAVTVAQTAIGLLRQHLTADARIHGVISDGGGALNVIPAHVEARYGVRAGSLERLDTLWDRVRTCFEAGALATGTEVSFERLAEPYSHFEHDADLVSAYRDNAETLGREFPPIPTADRLIFSTDMANVSLHVPSMHPMIAIATGGAGNHEPEFATAAASPAGDQAVIDGALALAWTAVDVAADIAIRGRLLAGKRNTLRFD